MGCGAVPAPRWAGEISPGGSNTPCRLGLERVFFVVALQPPGRDLADGRVWEKKMCVLVRAHSWL
jgi:hypothetical protein